MKNINEYINLLLKKSLDYKTNINIRKNLLNSEDSSRLGMYKLLFSSRTHESCRLWLNLAGWTFNPKRIQQKKSPHLPFILYEYQHNAVTDIFNAIDNGEDCLIDKSREMGASWLNLAIICWWWLFVPDFKALISSRVEQGVDTIGDIDSLMERVIYIINHLPLWLRPKFERKYLHLYNLDNGSAIDGAPTTPHIGRGGRRNVILLDEFAHVEKSREILRSTRDVADCRLFNSTPNGLGNGFADRRFSGDCKIINMLWWMHPERGKNKRKIELIDGSKKWTSPWYEEACKGRSERDIKENLDCDYVGSGDKFFRANLITELKTKCKDCTFKGELVFNVRTIKAREEYKIDNIDFKENKKPGCLKLFCELKGNRPDPDANYVCFADIGYGDGASNSVARVARRDNNSLVQVASLVTSFHSPSDFANYTVALCKWFGGQRPVFLGWESNGVGLLFKNTVISLSYPYIYYEEDFKKSTPERKKNLGWYSSQNGKELLLNEMAAAWSKNEYIIYDKSILEEADLYIWSKRGRIEPQSTSEEYESGAKKPHGDRVIAAAGCVLLYHKQHKFAKPPIKAHPTRSLKGRLDAAKQQQQQQH